MNHFEYVTKTEYKNQSQQIWEIIRNIQQELKKPKNWINNYAIKLNFLLIGSTKHRLVTRKQNEHYDFDFNVVITNFNKFGVDYIKEIREKIEECFKMYINNWNS